MSKATLSANRKKKWCKSNLTKVEERRELKSQVTSKDYRRKRILPLIKPVHQQTENNDMELKHDADDVGYKKY